MSRISFLCIMIAVLAFAGCKRLEEMNIVNDYPPQNDSERIKGGGILGDDGITIFKNGRLFRDVKLSPSGEVSDKPKSEEANKVLRSGSFQRKSHSGKIDPASLDIILRGAKKIINKHDPKKLEGNGE